MRPNFANHNSAILESRRSSLSRAINCCNDYKHSKTLYFPDKNSLWDPRHMYLHFKAHSLLREAIPNAR
jgi:hypothetical protein